MAAQQRTDIDVEEFRQILQSEHDRLTQLLRHEHEAILEENAEAVTDSSEHGDSAMALNDYVREQTLDNNERDILRQIDDALARIEAGTYGICVMTGDPIPVERLQAIPYASMTVEAAERAGL